MKFDGHFHGIRARFIRWTAVFTISISILAGLLFYVSLRLVLHQIGSDFAVQYTLREKGRILSPLEREVALCETLANSPAIVDWTRNESNPALKAAAMREMECFRQQFQDRSFFLVLRNSGHYYFRDDATGVKGDMPVYTLIPNSARDAWFYSTLEKVDRFHLNVDHDVVVNQTKVWINTIVKNGSERVAVAGTGVKLDSFIQRLLNPQNPAVTPILVDPSGAIQAHPNRTLIDQSSISKKKEEQSTIYKLLKTDDDRKALYKAFVSLRSSPESAATLSLVIDNQKRVVSVAYLPQINWYLVSLIDLSQTIHMGQFAPFGLVMIFALGLLVVTIVFLINRTILGPLDGLTASARAITAGDYSIRAKAKGDDEISVLTRTFNSMLDTIERNTRQLRLHSDELEQRVHERTAALEDEVKERKKAEIAAQQASQAKSEFLANMSHEIRTPMNAILGFSEILANKIEDPRHREYINAVHSSGKSLLNLINDVLDLSKVEAGKLRLEYTAIDPRRILKELEMIFSRKIEEKNLSFSTVVEDDFPKAVVLDEMRLRQVLLNLIGNAIKFTESGFVRVVARVDKDAAPNSLGLIFEVHDSGIGIPADQTQTIFGAFEQQKGQSHAKYGGTGLGLAISKRLVELMGGTLSVESTVGKGSVFRVSLPNVEDAAIADSNETETITDPDTVTFERASILVAEDNELNRELIKGFLEGYHLDILEATNGLEAVQMARDKKPALVLMDIKMPELDGIEASRILKEDGATRSIPIVAVTASTMKSEEAKIESTCEGFLRKPVARTELLNVLLRFLKHSINAPAAEKLKPEEPFFNTDPAEVHDPEGLQLRIEKELGPMWQNVKGTTIVNEVLEFAEKAIAIANAHKHKRLAAWADSLRNSAMLFDMHAVEQSLAQFPNFMTQAPIKPVEPVRQLDLL